MIIFLASGASTQPAAFKPPISKPGNNVTPEFLVQQVSCVLDESLVREVGGLYQFNILGVNGGTWILDLTSGSGSITKSSSAVGQPNVVLTMTEDNMQKIFRGEITPFNAYMQELLKVEGDLRMAMNLDVIVEKIKRRRSHDMNQQGVFVV